jgi:5-methylcytosine-specific restriction endonuclease McrA
MDVDPQEVRCERCGRTFARLSGLARHHRACKGASAKRAKATIPKAVRAAVWNTYVGEDVGCIKCTVCGVNNMSQLNFHCAHVTAEAEGGPTTVENLRPTCATCNTSMGTTNLHDFKNKHFP